MNRDWDQLDASERARLIEQLRQTGLKLDREGRWWHEGELVAHSGLSRALHRWLDQLEDGRFIVRLDAERYAYVDVEDAPLTVRTLTFWPGDRIQLHLSDETVEELAYGTLRVGEDHALYCRARGRFDARFTRQAYYLLGERIVEHGAGHALDAAGQRWPINPRATSAE